MKWYWSRVNFRSNFCVISKIGQRNSLRHCWAKWWFQCFEKFWAFF